MLNELYSLKQFLQAAVCNIPSWFAFRLLSIKIKQETEQTPKDIIKHTVTLSRIYNNLSDVYNLNNVKFSYD